MKFGRRKLSLVGPSINSEFGAYFCYFSDILNKINIDVLTHSSENYDVKHLPKVHAVDVTVKSRGGSESSEVEFEDFLVEFCGI